MDYVRFLVGKGYIDAEAIVVVQAERDPPSHGVGLHSVGGPGQRACSDLLQSAVVLLQGVQHF